MTPGVILASLVGLAVLLAGSHLWAYRRGRKEGEKRAYDKSSKKFIDKVLPLVSDPNSMFDIRGLPESKDKAD
ncbi:MAG: hypothetical protein ACXABY_19455 [Candidatus Thorarchaeota archaeon]